jgi:hypothetical protein
MPLSLNFNIPPKPQKTSKSSVDKAQSKEARDIKKRKYRSDLLTLDSLRETLFLPDFKKEDDIIISFRYHTSELISISEDGKFGIKYNEMTRDCTLYHYKKPIVFDYNLEMEAVLRSSSDIEIYRNIEITHAEDIMIRIVREEYAERKKNQLLKVDSVLRKEMEERRKQEEELEKADSDFLLQEEMENIYIVPNEMMDDLFGKGADDVIEILETLVEDNFLLIESEIVKEEKEEIKEEKKSGGLIGGLITNRRK